MKNAKLTPANTPARTTHKIWWNCPNGNDWQATHTMRTRNGCPKCFAENRRQIIATNLEDGVEYTFAGTTAANALGCHTSNIGKCLSGDYRSTKGDTFRDANIDA